MAFGKRGYYQMAYNMALSIRTFSPGLQIHLICDIDAAAYLAGRMSMFDDYTVMRPRDYTTLGAVDPGKAKVRMYKYLPYDHNLYLDVDGIALKDITPMLDALIEKPGFYLTDVIGRGGIKDSIEYAIWATNETTYKHFEIPEKNNLVTIQSSYAYFERCPECEAFCNEVAERYDTFDAKDLTMEWGRTKPDELFYSGVISRLGFDANGGKYIFFGHQVKTVQLKEIVDANYILSIYGNGNGARLTKLIYWEMYDRLMRSYCRTYSAATGNMVAHIYKTNGFAEQKHAGQRK